MPVIKKINPDKSSILCVWKIDESIETLIDAGRFGEMEMNILNAASNLKVRAQKMAARILIKEILGESFILRHEVYGRPYIQDSNIRVSITHSKDMVAVLFSSDKVPGIDIEYYNQRIYRITEKYLSDKESDMISNSGIESLLLYWNAKEVIYKIVNNQQLSLKENIFIHPFDIERYGEFSGQVNFHNTKIDFNLHYELLDNYTLVWALK